MRHLNLDLHRFGRTFEDFKTLETADFREPDASQIEADVEQLAETSDLLLSDTLLATCVSHKLPVTRRLAARKQAACQLD